MFGYFFRPNSTLYSYIRARSYDLILLDIVSKIGLMAIVEYVTYQIPLIVILFDHFSRASICCLGDQRESLIMREIKMENYQETF